MGAKRNDSLMKMMKMSGKNGFTLIEILIAIFILTTVLTTIYAAYTGTFRIVKDTQYADGIYSMARTAMGRMTKDIGSVCGSNGSFRFVSVKSETKREEFMELSFLSSAHLNFYDERSSGIAAINYFIIEEDGEEGCILKRKDELYREKPEGAEEEVSRDGGYILCEELQSLVYTFYDEVGEEYDSWNSESDSKAQHGKGPTVVSIQMAFINPDDEDRPYRFMTKVFLPVAGE
ncbi:MAG: type II secretion system protein [Deltaproteobacteria bacterium]|nr:type II secretion system protein [Deltaproteobacteria bacterium]